MVTDGAYVGTVWPVRWIICMVDFRLNISASPSPLGTITLTRAQFDALPIHPNPPGKKVALRWKVESGGKWWLAEYVDHRGYVEIKILEIVIGESETR